MPLIYTLYVMRNLPESKHSEVMYIEKYKDEILSIILRFVPKENYIVFLFGSYAQGNALQSSDIDVGIWGTQKIDDKVFLEITERIDNEVKTLRKIDLVDFFTLDEKVKKEAFQEIVIWHKGKNCNELLNNLK